MSTFQAPAPARPQHPVVRVAIVFSGKRKSGKDFLSDQLYERCGADVSEIGRLSGPLKKAFADERGLDFQQLLTDGSRRRAEKRSTVVRALAATPRAPRG